MKLAEKYPVGSRLILNYTNPSFSETRDYREVTVLEYTPSNRLVKLQWGEGSKVWEPIGTLKKVYEVLGAALLQ